MRDDVLTGEYQHDFPLLKQACNEDDSEDVILHEFRFANHQAALLYVDGLSDDSKIQRFILSPLLQAAPPQGETAIEDYLCDTVLPLCSLTRVFRISAALHRVFSGDAALICDGMPGALVADVKGFAHRSLQQPVNESVVMGPHEGFTESLRDNVVLIRRLLRTPNLISEAMTVGKEIPSRLCLLYLRPAVREENVQEIRRRIDGCQVDYVSSIGMLEQLIEDAPFSLLPQTVSTERPDRAVSFLNEGQILILMENAPTVLALPAGFWHLFHAPDDTALRWPYGVFLRLLRLLGLLIALLLPAVFICLTVYHPQGMSLSLLTSIMESQERVPFSLFTSTLLMLLIFSLISEAGARVPGAMGSSISIVGGLILGQAAVEADLISPLVIIVVALSGLGTYAVPIFPLTLSLRICQLLLVLSAGFLGFPGLVLTALCLFIRLCANTSLGAPIFAPLAPERPHNPGQMLRSPIWRQRLRGMMADPRHMRRAFGPMRAWEREKNDRN